MKICFVDWFAYSLFNPKSVIVFGGAQIQLYLLAQELAKDKKFNICFLTDNQKTNKQERFGEIKVYQFIWSQKNLGLYGRLINLLYKFPFVSYIHFSIRLLSQLREINADVFFQRAASAETGLIAFFCSLLNKQFIFMIAHEQDINGSFIRKNGWRGQLFLLGLKLADKIICQTKDQQTQLSQSLKSKSIVIASGYPIKSLNKIKIKKQGVLWVARAEDWKRPDLFIKLAKNLPQEKFIMICPPAENNPDYFKIISAKAGRISNLKFIKFVPFKKIDTYFAKAKVFISTSVSEGFPNTFIQAAKNKTLILSFQVNPDNIINKHQIGFCADANQGQMVILLGKLLKDNRLRRRLAANAYLYVKKYHDIKQTAVNIIDNIF